MFFLLQVTLSHGSFFRIVHVGLTNRVGPGLDLTIHCQSKDEDLGVHVLPPGGLFEWSFRPSLWSTTLFFCRIQSKSKEMSFNIYVHDRDVLVCDRHCYWDVTPNGPCQKKGSHYGLCFKWPVKKVAAIKQWQQT